LRELENNYHIDALTHRFPEAQLWLYAETVLQDSPAEGRRTIAQAMNRLREGAGIKEVLGRLYQDLRRKLARHDQQYFLARAAYPHLDVEEKAELVTTSEVGHGHADLVTAHVDDSGRAIRIRPAVNSRELDTLHRIFYTGGIGGGLTAHERFLVVVDAAGHVIGGVGAVRRTPRHVLLDKIAVLPRCRGRGIGKLLLQDFLRRRKAEGVTIVSAEFIRASWLGQFGFRSHPRYPGVVLPLTERRP
jgi:GNAT superfamily N-acetyltransferase